MATAATVALGKGAKKHLQIYLEWIVAITSSTTQFSQIHTTQYTYVYPRTLVCRMQYGVVNGGCAQISWEKASFPFNSQPDASFVQFNVNYRNV